jgi:hypothetical protein
MMAREAGSPWANGNNRLTLSVFSSSLNKRLPWRRVTPRWKARQNYLKAVDRYPGKSFDYRRHYVR